MTDLLFGIIIGASLVVLVFLLFRDLFFRKLLESSVPMIKNPDTGELLSVDELDKYKEEMTDNIMNDLLCSYSLLEVILNTIVLILEMKEVDPIMVKKLNEKMIEIKEVMNTYKQIFNARGIDPDDMTLSSTKLAKEMTKRHKVNNTDKKA